MTDEMASPGGYEIQTDVLRLRVWIHGPDGSTVARFDTRFGMDIHRSVSAQLAGEPQCLHCTHSKPTGEDWARFRDQVKRLFGVKVPSDAVVIDGLDLTT